MYPEPVAAYSGGVSVDALKLIEGVARCWQREVPPQTAVQLEGFLSLLLAWNVRINLSGAKNLVDLVSDHLPDSFAMATAVSSGASVCDVGSGGGLPALPFAMLRPDCQVTLVEPRAKRTAFLHAAVRLSGCANVRVRRARLEDLDKQRYDVAASRATFPPLEWMALAQDLVTASGSIIVFAAEGVEGRNSLLVLRRSLEYQTGKGSRRWMGTYCST